MRRVAAVAAALACAALIFFFASPAHAYPWMIRHGYSGCVPCHTDPSGGAGALTEYGRAQGELLMGMRYGNTSDEASKLAGLLWGAIQPPEQLRFGGDFREGFLSTQPANAPVVQQLITMQADAYVDVKISRFRADGSIGYAPQGALAASLTGKPSDNLISREHWVGAELDEDGSWLLRAGRMALPYGIRMVEHNFLVQSLTRVDINDTQQYGLALAVTKETFRAEIMGIAGNFQVHPDVFRERGYAGYFEYEPTTTLALGVSSMFTRATRDIVYGITDYRASNGAFMRFSPVTPLVILAEVDSVYQSLTWHGHRGGWGGFVQFDYEPVQGFHTMLSFEGMNGGQNGEPLSSGGWLSAVWFFLPHMDLRIDGIYTAAGIPAEAGVPASHTNVTTWLAQFHVYL
ncbi:MAG: hypothetical protein FWD17_05605 [Polyangiaceae bacterium]|nr:hypothetical protein [Polyangiaceae bacterium]